MSQYSVSQEFSQVEDAIVRTDDLFSGPVNSTENIRQADQQSAAIAMLLMIMTSNLQQMLCVG